LSLTAKYNPFFRAWRPAILSPSDLLGAEDEGIAVEIFERSGCAPVFAFRLHDELHALTLHFAGRGFDVIRPKSNVHLTARLKTFAEFEKDDAGVGAGDAEFDPTLFFAEWLIGEQAEAQFLGVERKGAILITYRDACELDSFDHSCLHGSLLEMHAASRLNFRRLSRLLAGDFAQAPF